MKYLAILCLFMAGCTVGQVKHERDSEWMEPGTCRTFDAQTELRMCPVSNVGAVFVSPHGVAYMEYPRASVPAVVPTPVPTPTPTVKPKEEIKK